MKTIPINGATVVVVKTGGVAAGLTALATVGIFAVTAYTALTVKEAADDIKTKVSKFVGEPDEPKVIDETSKELVKDTKRTKVKRFIAKSFLKNIFK